MSDAINPDHYKRLPAEAIKIIESAISNAPSNNDAYLHGQVLKYVLRCWNKNGIEDLRKAKWYLDRLIDSLDKSEQQKASDLQSLKDHPFGKLKQFAWTPKIGDWVKIKKPEPVDDFFWWPEMDEYDGEIVQVAEIDENRIIHDDWAFEFDWLEPFEQRAIEQSLNTKPLDGWRWLEVGEILRRLDATFDVNGTISELEPEKAGRTVTAPNIFIRRNRFVVGEKVVDCRTRAVFTVRQFNKGHQIVWVDGVSKGIESKHLAPYIEETT